MHETQMMLFANFICLQAMQDPTEPQMLEQIKKAIALSKKIDA